MTIDVRNGVYGSIAGGIYNMIDRAHAIISQRRVHQEPVRAEAVEHSDTTLDSGSPMEKLYNEIVEVTKTSGNKTPSLRIKHGVLGKKHTQLLQTTKASTKN